MNTRLGYACISETLQSLKPSVICGKTCRLKTAIAAGVQTGHPKGSADYSAGIYNFLADYGRRNLDSMYKIIAWSHKSGIYFYRMSSSMFPHIGSLHIKHHMIPKHWTMYNNLAFATDIIHQIGMYVQKYQIRLTMHPGQYNQMGAKDESVLINTFLDLSWQAVLLQLLDNAAEYYRGFDPSHENILNHSILCVHGGGTYKDKAATIVRWKQNFLKFPEFIRKRIALENDEKGYCVDDLLPICNELKIPLIFDFHHYACWANYHQDHPYQRSISDMLPAILETWNVRQMIPKFHLSDQAAGKKVGAHHDYVENIPNELLKLMTTDYRFDIMIEAKKKELATHRLQIKYKDYLYPSNK